MSSIIPFESLNVSWYVIELEEILNEAERRWLRPAEICEILRNHKKFKLTPDPPVMPPGISYFSLNFMPLLIFIFATVKEGEGMHFTSFGA